MRNYLLGTMFIVFACSAIAQEKKGGPAGPPLMMIPAFKDGADLPVKYSCSNAPRGNFASDPMDERARGHAKLCDPSPRS